MVSLHGARRRGIKMKQSDGVYCFTVAIVIHPNIHPSIHSTLSVNTTSESGSLGLCQAIPAEPGQPQPHQPSHPWVHALGMWEFAEALEGNLSPAQESNLKCDPKRLNTETALKCL